MPNSTFNESKVIMYIVFVLSYSQKSKVILIGIKRAVCL